jgi:hypothetical protein
MTTTQTTTTEGTRYVGNFPIIELHEEELLLFPNAKTAWEFQAAQEFRDRSGAWDEHEDLVYGERAFNHLRDELGYDADEAMDWVDRGDWAFLDSKNAIIRGAR